MNDIYGTPRLKEVHSRLVELQAVLDRNREMMSGPRYDRGTRRVRVGVVDSYCVSQSDEESMTARAHYNRVVEVLEDAGYEINYEEFSAWEMEEDEDEVFEVDFEIQYTDD